MSQPPEWAFRAAREWAKERLSAGEEPPWSYYRLMQLIDAIDSINEGLAATKTKANLLRSDRPEDSVSQQEGNIYQLDNAQPHSDEISVPLPM